jgi:hypothetical protein
VALLRCNQSSCGIQTKSLHDVLTNELCLPLSSVDAVKQLSTPLSVVRGALHLAPRDPTSLYTHQVMRPSIGQVAKLHNVNLLLSSTDKSEFAGALAAIVKAQIALFAQQLADSEHADVQYTDVQYTANFARVLGIRMHAAAINMRHLFQIQAQVTPILNRFAPKLHAKSRGRGSGCGWMQNIEKILVTEGVARAIKKHIRSFWQGGSRTAARSGSSSATYCAREIAAEVLNQVFVLRGHICLHTYIRAYELAPSRELAASQESQRFRVSAAMSRCLVAAGVLATSRELAAL